MATSQILPSLNFQNIPAQQEVPDVFGRFLNSYRQRGADEQDRKTKMLQNMLMEKKINSSGLDGLTGPAMEAYSLQKLKNSPNIDSKTIGLAESLFNSRTSSQDARTQNSLNRGRFMAFNALPAPDKANLLAPYRALGLDELTSMGLIADNVSPQQYAMQNGYSQNEASNLEKQYAPTSSTISSIQQTEGALAEEHLMSQEIDRGLSKFGRTLFGYSPEQVIGQFKSDKASIEDQAEFLKARALANEQSGIRAKLANSSSAHEALKSLQADSLNDFKIFRGRVSPEVYALTQKKLDAALSNMAKARIYAMKGQQNSFSKALKESSSKSDFSNLSISDMDEKIAQLRAELQGGR